MVGNSYIKHKKDFLKTLWDQKPSGNNQNEIQPTLGIRNLFNLVQVLFNYICNQSMGKS